MHKVNCPTELENVVYKVLPDGTADVWIRKNQVLDENKAEGEDTPVAYEADEIYFKVTAAIVTMEEIQNDVSFWFEMLMEAKEGNNADAFQVENVRQCKRKELSEACEAVIYAGVDVELSTGTEHFSLTEKDQINLFGKQAQLATGAQKLEYHNDGQPCKYYSAEDMQLILSQAMAYVSFQTTYCNSLFQWLGSMDKGSEILKISYGSEIPETFQTEVLKDFLVRTQG